MQLYNGHIWLWGHLEDTRYSQELKYLQWCGCNIAVFFRDLLADEPHDRAGAVNSLAGRSGRGIGSVIAGEKVKQAAGMIFWDSKHGEVVF
jgi:hypothetical protein